MEQDLVKFRKLWFVRHDILANRQFADHVEFKINKDYRGYLDCGSRDFSIFFYHNDNEESICYFRVMKNHPITIYRRQQDNKLMSFEQFFDLMKQHGLAEFLIWEVFPI